MGIAKKFKRRGKFDKIFFSNFVYFRSPSIDGKRTYHYKQRIGKRGRSANTIQITKYDYNNIKNKISKIKNV